MNNAKNLWLICRIHVHRVPGDVVENKIRTQYATKKVKSDGKINNKTTNLLQLLLLWIHIRGARGAPCTPQLIQQKQTPSGTQSKCCSFTIPYVFGAFHCAPTVFWWWSRARENHLSFYGTRNLCSGCVHMENV